MLSLGILFLLQGPIVEAETFYNYFCGMLFNYFMVFYLFVYLFIYLFYMTNALVTPAVYGRIMKIDSTKITKKFQGAKANYSMLGDERCRVPNPL